MNYVILLMHTGDMFRVHRADCPDVLRDMDRADSHWTFGDTARPVREDLREDFRGTYPEHDDDEIDGDIAACNILPCCEVS